MPDPVIAVIFDCDETLCPETTSLLVESFGLGPAAFWADVNARVSEGWDPPCAYMARLIELQDAGAIGALTPERLREAGSRVEPFPGLPAMFDELKAFVRQDPALRSGHVGLEFYIISGGLEEIVRGASLAPHIEGVFGCCFHHDEKGLARALKSTITFTGKTRFVFAISKGIGEAEAKRSPYSVNKSIPHDQRRIPMSRMIYVGDGPSDVPCLSLIRYNEGVGIGVVPPTRSFQKGFEMAEGKRTSVGPYTADYRPGSDMRKALEQAILRIGKRIVDEQLARFTDAPHY